MKLDIELSLQISDKIYLHSKNYREGIGKALLTEEALVNGLYVEGWHVIWEPAKCHKKRHGLS